MMEKKIYYTKFLIYAYLILKPFHIADLPFQIADALLLLLFFYLAYSKNVNYVVADGAMAALKCYICFMVWTLAVNMVWYARLEITGAAPNNSNFLLNSIYYIFNGIAIVAILWAYELLGKELLKTFVYGSFISTIITVIYSILMYDSSVSRQTAPFDNPNNLAHYALLMLTAGVLWGHLLKKTYLLLLVIGNLYLNIISLSKAGILSSIVLILLCLLYQHDNKGIYNQKIKALFILAGFLGGMAFLLLEAKGQESIFSKVLQRLLNMHYEDDSSFGSGRGYDRIFEMGSNFLWGMGEGAYKRFEVMNGKVVHSTFVSIYVSYGVIGVVFWCGMIFKCIINKHSSIFNLIAFSGIFLFWFTHNDSHNTISWMLFLLAAVHNENGDNKDKLLKNTEIHTKEERFY